MTNPLDLGQLKQLIDPRCISQDPADLSRHAYDAWPVAVKWRQLNKAPMRPDAVVRPRSVDDVSRVLAWASSHGVPVTPWGAGSAVTGAPLPAHGGISLEGLVHLLGGNFSARDKNRMTITGHRSAKRNLTADNLFEVTVDGDEEPEGVSKTLGIHRAIFRRTGAGAVVHAHPYYTTLLSYYTDCWSPIDENGIYYLGDTVYTVAAEGYMKWNLLEDELAELLTKSPAAVLKWHGTFTIGDSLAEAFNATQAVEISARLVLDSSDFAQCWAMLRCRIMRRRHDCPPPIRL